MEKKGGVAPDEREDYPAPGSARLLFSSVAWSGKYFYSFIYQPSFTPEEETDLRFNGESLLGVIIVVFILGRDVPNYFPINLGEGPGRRSREQVLVIYIRPKSACWLVVSISSEPNPPLPPANTQKLLGTQSWCGGLWQCWPLVTRKGAAGT